MLKEKNTFTGTTPQFAFDVDFILNHFQYPLFPRAISTRTTEGRQIIVNCRDEIIARFEQSDFIDVRINAFPYYIEHKGRGIQKSNFIFIDLDKSQFINTAAHTRALNSTLHSIREKLNGHPTVLSTGNGYHIYQPLEGIILEDYEEFNEFKEVPKHFLRFTSGYFTGGKSDPNNYPSLKSCLLRVPGSINSKYGNNTKVGILQRWNGFRPHIKLLIGSFHTYMRSMKIKEVARITVTHFGNKPDYHKSSIPWIETMLNIPIADYRKSAVALILSPYLSNIRKLPYEESFVIIRDWLSKCNTLREIDGGFNQRIKYSLENAIKSKRLPMKFDTLRCKNQSIHQLIISKGNAKGSDYAYEK